MFSPEVDCLLKQDPAPLCETSACPAWALPGKPRVCVGAALPVGHISLFPSATTSLAKQLKFLRHPRGNASCVGAGMNGSWRQTARSQKKIKLVYCVTKQ